MITECLQSPMDPLELVYVVAADDDLPVSLQISRADGVLQPRILSQLSLRRTSNGRRDIAVYDEEGNDMAEDVTIEVVEYIMDENGDLFRLNGNLLLNCQAPVNTDRCTKALISGDISEPVVVTNLKADDVQMMTFCHGSSHTSVQLGDQECDDVPGDDEVDVNVAAAKSTQVTSTLSSHGVTDSNCGNFSISFSSPAIEKTSETDQNTVTSSVLSEESPLPMCVSNSRSSTDLQSGDCTVPSSPESLCHSIPDSVSKVDLAAADDCQPTSHISASSSDAEKYTTTLMDTAREIAVTVMSRAVDTAVMNTNTCDTICNSTTQLVQPCVSFSANCCSSSYSCEDCSRQIADQSVLNCVSVPSALADIFCNIESAASVVASRTDSNCVIYETDSDLFMDSMNLKDPVVDCAAECKLDSNECQFADDLHKPAASSVDNSAHSISSCSSMTDYNSSSTKQQSDEQIGAVSGTDISKGNLIVSALNTSESDHSNANDGGAVESVHVCADELSAEQPASDTELPSVVSVQGSVIDSAINLSELDHSNTNDSTPVESVHICPSVLSAERPASDKELTSNDSVCGAVNKQEVACLLPAADCGHFAVKEFVQQEDEVASPSEVPVSDAVDDVNSYNMEQTLDAVSTAASKDLPASQPTSDAAGFIVQQYDNTTSQSDLPVADDVDGLDSCYLSHTFDEAGSLASKDCLVSQPSSDTTGYAVQQNDDIASPNDVPMADGVDDRGNYNLAPAFDSAGTVVSKDCLASQPSSGAAELVMLTKDQQNTDTAANAECQLQLEYTMNHIYNGYRRDLMELASSYPSNIDEMRQRLCDLHRTKKRLRKLQRNEALPMCTSNTGTLQTSMDLDALCHVKCKRLKLEAVDQELTEREMLLGHKEEELNLRLYRLEQQEHDVCRREQILAQYCVSSPLQEIPNSVQIPICDVVAAVCESTHTDIMHHLPKRKVSLDIFWFLVSCINFLFYFFTVVLAYRLLVKKCQVVSGSYLAVFSLLSLVNKACDRRN